MNNLTHACWASTDCTWEECAQELHNLIHPLFSLPPNIWAYYSATSILDWYPEKSYSVLLLHVIMGIAKVRTVELLVVPPTFNPSAFKARVNMHRQGTLVPHPSLSIGRQFPTSLTQLLAISLSTTLSIKILNKIKRHKG